MIGTIVEPVGADHGLSAIRILAYGRDSNTNHQNKPATMRQNLFASLRAFLSIGLVTGLTTALFSASPALADSAKLVFNGHSYQRFDTGMSWTAAKTFCESKGAHLATVTSQAEHDFIVNNFAPRDLWLGASDAASEGTWVWVTGEPWSYTNWYPGEPNNFGGVENYLVTDTSVLKKWNDVPVAGDNFVPLCEWDSATQLSQGLVSHYVLAGNANDAGTQAQNGVAFGSVTFPTTVAGKFNPVPSDSSGYIDAPPALNRDTSFTVSAWVKPTYLDPNGNNPSQIVYERASDGSDACGVNSAGNFGVSFYNGQYSFEASTVAGATCTLRRIFAAVPPTLNAWSHVLGIYDSALGLQSLYVNGILQAQVNAGNSLRTVANARLKISRNSSSANQAFHGDLSDIRIYDRTVSVAEIAALAAMTPLVPVEPNPGPVSYYPFNGNANDLGSNGNAGVVSGTATFTEGAYLTLNPLATDETGWMDAAPPINRDTSMSFAVWVRSTAYTGDRSVFYERRADRSDVCGANAAGNFALEVHSGEKFSFATSTISSGACSWSRTLSDTAVIANQWYHVAGTYDKATGARRIYVNGNLETTATVGGQLRTDSNARLHVSRNNSASPFLGFHGDIDDLRFYDRVLTANEVASLAGARPGSSNGTCGTANGVAVATAPTANLCATGTANPATLTGPGPWTWTCAGVNGGTTASCAAPLLDITPPLLSSVSASSFTLTATSDEAATGYWIVLAVGTAAPTAAQVKSYAVNGGAGVLARGSGAMTANVAKTFTVTGLSANTVYDFYVVAEDAAGNNSAVTFAQNSAPLALAPLLRVLPGASESNALVMRGGRAHQWFQVKDASGVPLANANVHYRYALSDAVATSNASSAVTNEHGLLLVSTPALSIAGMGQAMPLGRDLVFVLLVDRVTHNGRVAVGPFPPSTMTYTVAARSFSQEWNVGVKAGLTASVGPRLGAGFKVAGLGARARLGYKVSAGGEFGMNWRWSRSVNGYGRFWDPAAAYSLSSDLYSLDFSIDAELGLKAGAGAEARAGFGAPTQGVYAGVGIDGELSATQTASVTYGLPGYFAPQSGQDACLLAYLTLAGSDGSLSFIDSYASQAICGKASFQAISENSIKETATATVGAGAFLSTRNLDMRSKDGNLGHHVLFTGVEGEVGATLERVNNRTDNTTAFRKALFAKTSYNIDLQPLNYMRGLIVGATSSMSSVEFAFGGSAGATFSANTHRDAAGIPTGVEFSSSTAQIASTDAKFGSFGMNGELSVEEAVTVHTRSSTDAVALADSGVGDIEFGWHPVVSKVEQALRSDTTLGGGFSTPPGYFVEHHGVSPSVEIPFELEGALGVGLDLTVLLSAEQSLSRLTERGRVAVYQDGSGLNRFSPLALETYAERDEISANARPGSDIVAKGLDSIKAWIASKLISLGQAMQPFEQTIVNGASSLTSKAGSAISAGWRFVFTRDSSVTAAQKGVIGVALARQAGNAQAPAMIGAVHFVNLLSPANENVDEFPWPFELRIGGVSAALAAAGKASSDVAFVRLVRVDRVTGRPVLVAGSYAAASDEYVADVTRRGAYYLVVDRSPPTLNSISASLATQSPKSVIVSGSFDPFDATGIVGSTFSLLVDGVELGVSTGPLANFNNMTGGFHVTVTAGPLVSGLQPSRLVVALSDGSGNRTSKDYCAYAVGATYTLVAATQTPCPAQLSGSLNITGAIGADRTLDSIILTRYLLGFRGSALTSGLSISGSRTRPVDIEAFIGDARFFDVFARQDGNAPNPHSDGLVLLRLVQGYPDALLLNGITPPSSAQLTTAQSIRAYVNQRLGTSF